MRPALSRRLTSRFAAILIYLTCDGALGGHDQAEFIPPIPPSRGSGKDRAGYQLGLNDPAGADGNGNLPGKIKLEAGLARLGAQVSIRVQVRVLRVAPANQGALQTWNQGSLAPPASPRIAGLAGTRPRTGNSRGVAQAALAGRHVR